MHLGRDFRATLDLDWSRWRFDAVKLETLLHRAWHSRRGEPAGTRRLHRLGAEHLGAAAYLLSRAGARKMLAATRPLAEQVDQTLFGRRAIWEGEIRALQLVPAIAVQDTMRPDAAARRELASTLHEEDRKRLAERVRAREAARTGALAARGAASGRSDPPLDTAGADDAPATRPMGVNGSVGE